MTVSELCERSVINISSGTNLGNVDDVVFSEKDALISHVVIYGRMKFFGFFGREDDIFIPWSDIKKVGEDVLLVETNLLSATKHTASSQKRSILFG